MKWPKEWVEAADARLDERANQHTYSPQHVLGRLHEVGALKDPPAPDVIYFCTTCNEMVISGGIHPIDEDGSLHPIKKYEEVLL